MNTTWQAEQQMNTTNSNYPGFQTLSRGVKRLLSVSAAHFPEQPASQHQGQKGVAEKLRARRINVHPRKKPLTFGDFVAGGFPTRGTPPSAGASEILLQKRIDN